MGEGSSIINIGELAKPATVLIEKISDAVGGIFKPYQITRVAEAEAKAALIRTKSDIKVTDLQERALKRFVHEEARKQENIEGIAAKAIPLLADKSQPQNMDDDWIANFFDKSRIVSDEEMQQLWSRILAGEANKPGTFSKRTVNLLESLDKRDAVQFATLCKFIWDTGTPTPFIQEIENKVYADVGLTFNILTHLDSIGLVTFNSVSGYTQFNVPQRLPVRYFEEMFFIDWSSEKNNELEIGHAILTRVGLELSQICESKPIPHFVEYVLNYWRSRGLIISCPYPRVTLKKDH